MNRAGTKDEDTNIQIHGMGPATNTPVERKPQKILTPSKLGTPQAALVGTTVRAYTPGFRKTNPEGVPCQ